MRELCHSLGMSGTVDNVERRAEMVDWSVSEEIDKDRAALGTTMVARIESEDLGSPTHEKV